MNLDSRSTTQSGPCAKIPETARIAGEIGDLVTALTERGVPPYRFNGLPPHNRKSQRRARALKGSNESASQLDELRRRDSATLPMPLDVDQHHASNLCWQLAKIEQVISEQQNDAPRMLYAGRAGTLVPIFLAARGNDVHVIDQDKQCRSYAEKIARRMGWNCSIGVSTLECLQYPDEHFDLAVVDCGFVDSAVERAALELSRCLRPQGSVTLLLTDYATLTHDAFYPAEKPRLNSRALLSQFTDTGYYHLLCQEKFNQPTEVNRQLDFRPDSGAIAVLRKRSIHEVTAHNRGSNRDPVSPPLISVIVCAYNRAERLKLCLVSLMMQQLDNDRYEIIVVDNNSVDETPELLADLASRTTNLRYCVEREQGLSHARNRGFAEARGTYLAYVDDDAWIPPSYLVHLHRLIQEHNPDLAGGPVYPYYTSRKPRWFDDKHEIRCYEEHSGFSTKCNISGSNFVIRRELLEELGLFDVELGMKGDQMGFMEERKVVEDYRDLRPEKSQRIYYSLDCYVRHHTPESKMTRRYILWRCYVAGKYKASITEQTLPQLLKEILRSYKETTQRAVKKAIKPIVTMRRPKKKLDWFTICIHGAITCGKLALAMNMIRHGQWNLRHKTRSRPIGTTAPTAAAGENAKSPSHLDPTASTRAA